MRRPMVTQSVTAAVLFGAGDIVAQQAIEGKGKNHNVRTLFSDAEAYLIHVLHFF
jgi:hypothetical protein